MAYDGTATPAAAQPPGAPQNDIQMQYAIAKALLGNQPQHMQSWLQPLGQMAQSALAMKYANNAAAAQRANAAAGLPGVNPAAAAAPAAAPGGGNPFASLFGGIFGGGNGP